MWLDSAEGGGSSMAVAAAATKSGTVPASGRAPQNEDGISDAKRASGPASQTTLCSTPLRNSGVQAPVKQATSREAAPTSGFGSASQTLGLGLPDGTKAACTLAELAETPPGEPPT